MRWLWIFASLWVCLGCFVEGRTHGKFKRTRHGESLKEITINLMAHYDVILTKQLKQKKITLKRIKYITKSIVRDVEDLFRDPQLHLKVNLRLLGTKFLRTTQISQDASKYLKSYCEWQKERKLLKNKQYYSVLFTGLDLYVLNSNGTKVRESVEICFLKQNKSCSKCAPLITTTSSTADYARAYRNGICNVEKSCALFEWRPDNIVHLLAHEIGHSLGMKHDEDQSHIQCKTGIMTTRYKNNRSYKKNNGWSICNAMDLKIFLANKKSDCLWDNN